MKIGYSKLSKKYNYIQKHHIIPKRFFKTKQTIDLTLDEHAEIHHYTDNIKNTDQILGFFLLWINNKIKR